MSLFRSSRVLLATRLPIAGGAARAPFAIRHIASRAGNTSHDSTSVAHGRTAVPSRTHEPNQPTSLDSVIPEEVSDAPCDSATSAYSPVPLYPENRGPDEPLAAAFISEAPLELQARTVRIYKPAKPATQSGTWNGRQWKMDWDVLGKGHRWENPLMGWQSSGDFMQGSHIFFKTKEDAIHFAEKQGYQWLVQEPNTREFRAKSYAANFLHSPKELKIIRTK